MHMMGTMHIHARARVQHAHAHVHVHACDMRMLRACACTSHRQEDGGDRGDEFGREGDHDLPQDADEGRQVRVLLST